MPATCYSSACSYCVCVCLHASSSCSNESSGIIAGPTGNYRGAAGRDASKAFVTGRAAHQRMPDVSSKGLQSRSCHHAESMTCRHGRAWHAGNFTADQTDDLTDYKPDELASIFRWRNFFREHKVSTS